jgi:hypothetical protein
MAAWIAASQLSKQLKHSKEKAADEAWWQQFEWVTDRIISSGQKGKKVDTRLPSSLAFDLMTSLSGSARASFQEDAVAGILNHYLKEFITPEAQSQEQDETPNSDGPRTDASDGPRTDASDGLLKFASDGPTMDAAGAKSLRNLIDVLPESSRAPARSVLKAYEHQEYEQEVLKALRHRFGASLQTDEEAILGADAVIQFGSRRIAIEVKLSIAGTGVLEKTGERLQLAMDMENATAGVIITPPTSQNLGPAIENLGKNRIHLIEWKPSMRSYALYHGITSVLGDNEA